MLIYVLAAIAAIVLSPALVFRPWNAAARWRRRRVARVLPFAAFFFVGCNLGDASEATLAGCGNLPCDAGMGGAAPSAPCAEQDPACPALPHLLSCPWYDGGPCQASECEGTWRDCNHDVTDGCETDTSTDPKHCGACNVACAMSCAEGVCK